VKLPNKSDSACKKKIDKLEETSAKISLLKTKADECFSLLGEKKNHAMVLFDMLVGKLEKEMDIYDLSVKFKKGEENLFVSMVDYIIFLIEKQNSMTEIPNAIKFLHDYVKEKKIILPTRYVSNTFFLK